ncbi:MAG: AAA family ATPase [Thermoguttaceae bacterium]|nr:AAA family ATPase [Thermoguttaceae bacterium]
MSERFDETTKINDGVDGALATNDVELLARFGEFKERFLTRLEREIVGRRAVLEEVLAGIFAGGHILLVGVPGLGKTKIARSIAAALDLKFRRIQFTPDLTPSDILGFDVLQEDPATGTRSFAFAPGPIFANVVLADEINRTPPKTQAALLEATQERQVTVAGRRYELDAPFFVVATQNPFESEGTYPLPDAQLDRFLFSVKIDYPKAADEVETVLRTTGEEPKPEPPTIRRDELLAFQGLIRRIPAPRRVVEHAVNIVRKTRPQTKTSIEATQQYVERGAGPRASQALILGAKAFAAFAGRTAVSADDVERAALPALRERVALNYLAQADGVDVDFLVRKILRDAREEYERG